MDITFGDLLLLVETLFVVYALGYNNGFRNGNSHKKQK